MTVKIDKTIKSNLLDPSTTALGVVGILALAIKATVTHPIVSLVCDIVLITLSTFTTVFMRKHK